MDKIIKELLLLHFLNDGVRTSFVTLLPFIAKDLNFSLTTVGFLGSAQPLLASTLALPAGFFASRLGGLKLLTSLLVVYSLGALLTSFSTNITFVILSFLLAAGGFGMFHTVGFSLVAKSSDKSQIGKNMGNFTSIGDIGRVTIPTAAVFLVAAMGWRQAMIILSITGFTFYILLQLFKARRDIYQSIEQQKRETHQEFLRHLSSLLKSKRFALTLIASIFDALASTPVIIFLPFLLLSKEIQITEYGFITGAFFVGSLAGKYLLGRGVDKIGNFNVFLLSEILMAASLMLLMQASNFLTFFAISFFLGMFTRGTTPVIQTMMSQISEKMHYDKVFALSELFLGIAAMITVVVMGFVADQVGIYFVFYLCTVLAVTAVIPILFLRKLKV